MILRPATLGVLAALLLTSTSGEGRTPSGEAPLVRSTLTLPQALRLLSRSPWLEVQRAEEGLARAEVQGARVYPNPTLSYSGAFHAHGADTFDSTQHVVMLEQPVYLSGQRGSRRRAAEASVRRAQAQTELTLHELSVLLRRRFVDALAAQERTKILRDGATDLERVTDIVRGRFEAGDRSRYDVIRLQTELTLMKTNVTESEGDEVAASFQVAALLGRPGWSPVVRGELTASAPTASRVQHPAERTAQLSLDARAGAMDAARRERAIVPSVAAGIQSTTRDYGSAVVVGLAVPLPVFDRAQGTIAAASAEHRIAAANLRAVRTALAAERARAQNVLQRRVAALRTFERNVLPSLNEIREMAEGSYRDGQSGVLELLDALTMLRELRLEHLERQVAVKHAEIDVLEATGTATDLR